MQAVALCVSAVRLSIIFNQSGLQLIQKTLVI